MIGRALRWQGVRVALLFAVCLSIGPVSISRARSLKSAVVRHKPAFPPCGIVGFSGDHFLLWEDSGQMQIGTFAGEWKDVFRVPLHPVHDVVADAQGILLGGSLAPGSFAALLVNQAGQEVGRWLLGDDVFAVRVEAGVRFATTPGGIVPLLAGGVVGPPRPYVGADLSRHGDPPDVLRVEPSAMVTCRLRDVSMEHNAPGRCRKANAVGWWIEGPFNKVIACGDWLVSIEVTRTMSVAAYSLTSKKRAFHIDEPMLPAITCAAPGILLVGERRLSMFRLPDTRPIWTAKPNRGRIGLIAATEHAIAFSEDVTGEVVVIPRPTSAEPLPESMR